MADIRLERIHCGKHPVIDVNAAGMRAAEYLRGRSEIQVEQIPDLI